MAPVLPASLSPHICILQSPDLLALLQSRSLPPLPNILQSFSPLPQVTTRTTTLTSIPHSSFALRFSDLLEIEDACKEDDNQRAVRTIDWITARINKRCTQWIQIADASHDTRSTRSPWWDELRRCVEGDHVPSKQEGWNHPVAVILAVSTSAPNPLQVITNLQSRPFQFPSWVDPNILRYILIIHPQDSLLSDEEAGALFNAVKKQFGLHCYLLPLALPSPPTAPVPVPALLPRLPPLPTSDSSIANHLEEAPNRPGSPSNSSSSAAVQNTLRMDEKDIQQTARFAREFVVMSLVPSMEKCVMEWNENFSSTRRLPSRLFSSTRRLFGSTAATPSPTHTSSSSISSISGQTSGTWNGIGPPPPSQQRRLAEFATILGDFKLAVTVWEALRKESKGGSDILPILSSPSTALQLHASNALASINPSREDLSPHGQLHALLCAVRWEASIPIADFIGNELEGEQWLVWAAGNSEEAPSAILLAHAALLSTRKNTWRRAALWYISAANRLEKCGIKPLTMYFFRRAQELYKTRPLKNLSPSFWESEGKPPNYIDDFDDIMSGIEYPLGRLLYTTGDVTGAVQFFLGLLKGSSKRSIGSSNGDVDPGNDRIYLDDFRVAYTHLTETGPEKITSVDFKLPFKLCQERETKLRFGSDGVGGEPSEWEKREEDWLSFWKSNGGREGFVKTGQASTDETFWVDLSLRNPLDTEINISNLTLLVQESTSSNTSSSGSFIEVEVIQDVQLASRESRLVPISVKSKHPASLVITHAKYDFLSLLPITEGLAYRGKRLQDTPAQRQKPTYAPDVVLKVEVVQMKEKLLVDFVDDGRLVLMQGENKTMQLWLSNAGSLPVSEVWVVTGIGDEIWFGEEDKEFDLPSTFEVISSANSLKRQTPRRLKLRGPGGTSTLQSGESMEIPVVLHADSSGEHDLCLFFVYREDESKNFHSIRLSRSYTVYPMIEISASATPSQSLKYSYILSLEIINRSHIIPVELEQLTTLSPLWKCECIAGGLLSTIPPSQTFHVTLGANPWTEGNGGEETLEFISSKLSEVLLGKDITVSDPPALDLICSRVSKSYAKHIFSSSTIQNFVHSGRQKYASHATAGKHSYIPSASYPSIFPLYNPNSVDIVCFWQVPSQRRSGHVFAYGLLLGACHAALEDIIEEAESTKIKRSMYAETRRENMEVLDAIRGSEWNREMNPIVVSLHTEDTMTHNFANGPCQASVKFTLRNFSLTREAQYTLKLNSTHAEAYPPTSNLLSPPYSGKLTFRGSIPPSQFVIIQPKLWITQPGAYGLGGWALETRVARAAKSLPAGETRTYMQTALPGDQSSLTVCDS